MTPNGKNLGNYDFAYDVAANEAYLARNTKNDCESELTTNHFNRIFHKLIAKIKNIFKKK